MSMIRRLQTRLVRACFVCSLMLAGDPLMSNAAETIPGEVSDIVRDLGEMRDITWGLLGEARKAYVTNEFKLAELNVRYIEASAVANSLIEQFQLETAARTSMDVKRYSDAVSRARQKCEAFMSEWRRIMREPAKTRGGGSTSEVDNSLAQATKAVAIADGLLSIVMKNKKAFRDLDATQRAEVRTLLEERKWRPLEWQAPATKPAIATPTVSEPAKPSGDTPNLKSPGLEKPGIPTQVSVGETNGPPAKAASP